MTATLKIGFIPLVDAALLVAARDEGFAESEGLALDLMRDVSWATLRDRLAVGVIDAAHMLAPAAIAMSLGYHQLQVAVAAPICLNRNGNAVTISTSLSQQLRGGSTVEGTDVTQTSRALAAIVEERRRTGEGELVFATTYPFSMHSILLKRWFSAAGPIADDAVRLEVMAPQFMASALLAGEIDGFCAGAPWNALAVQQGAATIVHFGVDLMRNAPEKLLAWRADDLERRRDDCDALVRALVKASHWCSEAQNWPKLAQHLARADLVDAPAALIERILGGQIIVEPGGTARSEPSFIRLDPDVLRPRLDDARLIGDAMVALDLIKPAPRLAAVAEAVFRSDVYDEAVGAMR